MSATEERIEAMAKEGLTIDDLNKRHADRVAALAATMNCREDGTRGRVGVKHTRIQCVETGEWHASLADAARRFDGHASMILHATRTGQRAYGFHWRKAGQEFKPHPRDRRYPVVDLDTQEQWPSIQAAAKAIGVLDCSLRTSLRHGWRCRGRRVAFRTQNGAMR